MSELGVALVGAGAVGALRARAAARTPGLRLRIVADGRLEAAEVLARRFGASYAPSFEEAVRRPDVGLVIVSTPPDSHAEIACAALEAGRHVLCEKPLARSSAEALRMCQEAERRGLLLKTGFNHRYFPAIVFARRLLDTGRLGEVVSVTAYAGHPGGQEFGHAWVHEPRTTGGGSLMDNGIHVLDLARFFAGEVETAKGYVANLIWPFPGAEDNGLALFRTARGALVYVRSSWTEWRGYRFWVETAGTRGYVRASYPPMLAEWGSAPEPGVRARRRLELFPLLQVKERLLSWRWTIVRSFVEELTALLAGIRAGREVPATGRDGLRAVQMAEAVYRSSREGLEVRL